MRRVVVLAILALLTVSTAAWADIIVVNKGGLLSVSTAGIVLNTSHMIQYGNVKGTGLGFVSFSTGALTSGSLATGGVFSSSGSSFVITGASKQVPKGVIFNGTFVGDIDWTLISQSGGTSTFDLSGTVTGQLFDGRTITGTTSQTIVVHNRNQPGIGHLNLGTSSFNTPEPGTLSLLGTGLVGLGSFVRRRLVN